MLEITPTLAIPEEEIEKRFTTSSGPGGQNVNKVATRVELRLDLRATRALPRAVLERLHERERGRITKAGVLRVVCQTHREQQRNLEEARHRLAAIIRSALARPPVRRPTRPTRASEGRRLADKRHRSDVKRRRGRLRGDE